MTFTILGPPRTKKNHQRILRTRGGRRFIAQAATATAWEESAVLQLRSQWFRVLREGRIEGNPIPSGDTRPIVCPVNMRALVYRERAGRADLLNYLAAVSDALERAGVVLDDQLVAAVDGSRLFVDRARPRVELELTPMAST